MKRNDTADVHFAWWRRIAPKRVARTAGTAALLVIAALAIQLSRAQAVAGITAVLEEPGNGQTVAGVRNVRGWTFSGNSTIKSVEMFIDGVSRLTVPCCGDRGDVQAAVPGAPLASG